MSPCRGREGFVTVARCHLIHKMVPTTPMSMSVEKTNNPMEILLFIFGVPARAELPDSSPKPPPSVSETCGYLFIVDTWLF